MKTTNTNKSMEEILRDTQHNKKLKEVFLQLLALQRKPKNPFDELRSYSLPITKEIKPGAEDV